MDPIPTPTVDRRAEARTALEGPERTAKRLTAEAAQEKASSLEQINAALTTLAKEKERLELTWIELDDKRKVLKTELKPILEEEKAVETKEGETSTKEHETADPRQQQAVEEARWQLEGKRHGIEQKKWQLQEALWKVDNQIEDETRSYQKLLDEEAKLTEQLKNLNAASS